MIKQDHRGNILSTTRILHTRMNAHILAGSDWLSVAHVEIIRLQMEASAYHSQLEGRSGFDELGRAVVALREAHRAIEMTEDLSV